MNKIFYIFILNTSFIVGGNIGKPLLSEKIQGFEIFLGKYFKGETFNSTKLKPISEVIHFKRILNGQAVRIVHSINEGEFGGETIITWNQKNNVLESIYFSTGGTIEHSVVTIKDNTIIFIEDVSNNKNSIKKVKNTYHLNRYGQLKKETKYYLNNMWVFSHSANYSESKSSEIIFN